MTLKNPLFNGRGWWRILLQGLNLRAEESERTLLMFAVYTTTSVGLLWLEATTVALFLEQYGSDKLPWIYIASAVMGSGLGILSTWMQRVLPLRRFVVLIGLISAIPLLLFRLGLEVGSLGWLTIFVLPLWVDGGYSLNHLTTSLTANQLFNIREIKRTFPLISSGVLVADVLSGFSLPLLLRLVGLNNVILVSAGMLVLGAGILFYLSQRYKQAFPDAPYRDLQDEQSEYTNRRLKGPLQEYAIYLFGFFIISQILLLLIDFQYLTQLELKFDVKQIASFLGLFSGIVGIFELITQWFISSRVIERMGVFLTAMLPGAVLSTLGLLPLIGLLPLFIGLIVLKFSDELLRYTFVASTSSVLFQPIPDNLRGNVETKARGIAEPVATGLTGIGILSVIWVLNWVSHNSSRLDKVNLLSWLIVLGIVLISLVWLLTVWLLRSRYLDLLVLSAQRGQLSGVGEVDLRILKRAVVEALEGTNSSEADKRSCIELLTQIDPQNVGDVLAPLLKVLPPALQYQSLESMLIAPNTSYLPYVKALIDEEREDVRGQVLGGREEENSPNPQPPTPKNLQPEVLALALRYIWLTEPNPDLRALKPYLEPEVNPVVRGTAAALLLRLGNTVQKAEATSALRRMLTHPDEEERVMGCRALGDALYLQALRVNIPGLLQDKSLRVRRALLEAIAATHLEEYYPALLRGLEHKATREAAIRALERLENEAIPMVLSLATNIQKPDLIRRYAWDVLGRIGTKEAQNVLVANLMTAWGNTRRHILQILLKLPQEAGIDAVLDRLGRSGVETLIGQELMFIGQLYAAMVDLKAANLEIPEIDLIFKAFQGDLTDAAERCFLLMKFLYSPDTIQAAAFNLRSGSISDMARGLEILDQTVDIFSKRELLTVLERHSEEEKLRNLAGIIAYQPLEARDRIRRLLSLRRFLSDWSLACCFHLAAAMRWNLTAEPTLACLRHPTGFVREATIAYLKVASPRSLPELLPKLKQDPDRLVAAQVQQLMAEFLNKF
ncbi:HEAT repeat domain-containing protein [Floridanema evergladense]|uniref:HEAT repeat domain-containing protein n=1 Tax=Floridaenema evergladense BLCC-F167 TaxID=3153639 RepID=A0ABV4WSP9_9CYAN